MSAFEAVLPACTLSWVFVGFFQSIVAYSGVFVAQYHGAKNPRMCAASHKAAMSIAFASGALLLGLLPATNWILAKTAPSPELLEMERTYCGICMAGGVFACARARRRLSDRPADAETTGARSWRLGGWRKIKLV